MTATPQPLQVLLFRAPADEAAAALAALERSGARVTARTARDAAALAGALDTPLDLVLLWDGTAGSTGPPDLAELSATEVVELTGRFARRTPVVVVTAPGRDEQTGELVARGAAALVYRDRLAPLTAIAARLRRDSRHRELVDLARAAAHDLNNLVAPIPLATRILADSVGDPAAAELLRTIETSVARATAAVDSLYRCALWSAGEMDEGSAPAPLRHLIEIVGRVLRDGLPGVRVETDYPPDLAPVAGPADAVRQLLLCLALAASSGVAADEAVSIAASDGGDGVVLLVRPAGGAPAAVVDELAAAAHRLGGALEVSGAPSRDSGRDAAAGPDRRAYRLRLPGARLTRPARA